MFVHKYLCTYLILGVLNSEGHSVTNHIGMVCLSAQKGGMGGTSYHQASRAGASGVFKGGDAEAGCVCTPKLLFSYGFSLKDPALLLRTL